MKVTGDEELAAALAECSKTFFDKVRGRGLRVVADRHLVQTRRRFATKVGPSGTRWKAWSAGYAKTRGPEHSLLISSGDLLASLRIEKHGFDLELGSDVPHAKHVQEDEAGADKRPYLGTGLPSELDELQEALDRWAGKTLEHYGLA